MNHVPTVAQVLGVFAVLLGVVLWLPLGAALVVDGVLVVAAATAAEHILARRPVAPSDGRDGPDAPAVY